MENTLLVLVTLVFMRDGLALTTDYFFSSTDLNWNQAEKYCEDGNGRLLLLNSQDKWDEYTDVMAILNKCSVTHWTALVFDSQVCETRSLSLWRSSYSGWSYNEWAVWRSATEPNDCPDCRCVVVSCDGMNTRDCGNSYKVMCKKVPIDHSSTTLTTHPDVTPSPSAASTTTQTTHLVTVTSEVLTTKQTQTTSKMTSAVRTDTQTTVTVTSEVLTTKQTQTTSEVTSAVRTETQTTHKAGGTTDISTTRPSIIIDTNIVANESCYFCCAKKNSKRQLNADELESSVKELKSQLAVNKTNLSATRRKLISVYDSRSSSVTMGGVAIAKLTVVFSLLIIPDMVSLVRFLYKQSEICTGFPH